MVMVVMVVARTAVVAIVVVVAGIAIVVRIVVRDRGPRVAGGGGVVIKAFERDIEGARGGLQNQKR
jgi:hypothetical protein